MTNRCYGTGFALNEYAIIACVSANLTVGRAYPVAEWKFDGTTDAAGVAIGSWSGGGNEGVVPVTVPAVSVQTGGEASSNDRSDARIACARIDGVYKASDAMDAVFTRLGAAQ